MLAALLVVLGAALALPYLAGMSRSRDPRGLLAFGLALAACIYVGFAWFYEAPPLWFSVEVGGVVAYTGLALALRGRPVAWLGAAWIAHGLWDIGLHELAGGGDFAPPWYPEACLGFDLAVGAWAIRWRGRE